MAKTKTPAIDQLAQVGEELAVAESLVDNLRERRDNLLLEAKEENPDKSLQALAAAAGMRREAAHYAVLRARARRGDRS